MKKWLNGVKGAYSFPNSLQIFVGIRQKYTRPGERCKQKRKKIYKVKY
ncbi:MAG: hypothetical protein AVDCRST_MAG56-7502 [uncultured Cytophagales bacterium]|uniref:Uncharacterized protein n=1 Tax=uncultured Cytophagales bacterium TaxID=158755 RepID=A0A6J4LHU7_9SPHI|nr:MAG: hypothetical protein AVDCRST_MAG56-7502 [uncultured Cytophagales bacterium]